MVLICQLEQLGKVINPVFGSHVVVDDWDVKVLAVVHRTFLINVKFKN